MQRHLSYTSELHEERQIDSVSELYCRRQLLNASEPWQIEPERQVVVVAHNPQRLGAEVPKDRD